MQILNWLPPHTQQIRYISPYYEEDNEGDRYCINEDECTSVWCDIIEQVHKTKRPMYYRRRTIDLARRDRNQYQHSIYNENDWKKNWAKSIHVRVKVIGKRVLFIYDEEFVHKNWIANKNKKELREKIRKFKEQKFKDYTKKILKDKDEESFSMTNHIDDIIENLLGTDEDSNREAREERERLRGVRERG